MSGFTPLFDSMARGTLCGKWPDIGLWGVLLAITDFRGEIDATPQYISTVSGLPILEVVACLRRFCEPDPGSRSRVENGARLVLIDPQRDWGWRVVNIQLYRRKASNLAQVTDGRNAEKVQRYKERHRRTPQDTAGHSETRSDTNSNSNSNSNKENTKKVANAPEFVDGLDQKSWTRWFEYRSAIKKPIKPPSITSAQRAMAKLGTNQAAAVERSIANSWQGLFPPEANGARKPTLAEEGWT